MTHIEKKDINFRATKLPVLEFEGSYARYERSGKLDTAFLYYLF